MILSAQDSDIGDSYAFLPDELLEDILDSTSEVAREVKAAYELLTLHQDSMRNLLLEKERILRAADLEAVPSPSISAVDGGLAIEKSIGADTILVAAVGVEGLVREDQRRWTGVQYCNWQKVLPHLSDASRLAFGVMAALELQIATQAPHDIVILDGLHLNPIIALNNMLSLTDPGLTPLIAEVLTQYDVLASFLKLLQRPSLIALVKYDSSHELSDAWFGDGNLRLDDRTLMTVLLKPGEYSSPVFLGLTPERRQQIHDLHIVVADRSFPNRDLLNEAFRDALLLMRQIYVTYYRPWEWAPAFRIEIKRSAAESTNRLATIFQGIREQVVSPEIREPYPQHLADQMAKSVGAGLQALRSGVMFELADSEAETLLRMLSQSYRT